MRERVRERGAQRKREYIDTDTTLIQTQTQILTKIMTRTQTQTQRQ